MRTSSGSRTSTKKTMYLVDTNVISEVRKRAKESRLNGINLSYNSFLINVLHASQCGRGNREQDWAAFDGGGSTRFGPCGGKRHDTRIPLTIAGTVVCDYLNAIRA